MRKGQLLRPITQHVGSLVAGVASYIAVRFLTSYFETRTLTPFAIYCAVAGIGSLVFFLV